MTTQKLVWSLLISGAVATAACGDAKSSMNPVAPSAVVVDGAQSSEAGGISSATAKNDKGKDKEKDKGNNGNGNQPTVPPTTQGPGNQTPTNTTPSAPQKVEIEGLISAKGGNTITVNAELVTVPSTAAIRHGNKPYKFADLKVGNRVHVKGMRTTTGTGAAATSTIEASEVKLQNP